MKQFYIQNETIKNDLMISSHNNYVIVLFDAKSICFINKKETICSLSDMVFLKPHQKIIIKSIDQHSMMTMIHLSPQLLSLYSDDECDLNEKFSFVPFHQMVIHGENETVVLLKNILHRMNSLDDQEIQIGRSIYERGLLSSFLILFLRECIMKDRVHQANLKQKFIIDDLFKYISHHLNDDLSLETLEKVFYISKEHICRRFKEETGMTLHQYILKTRIDLAKSYIRQGQNVQDLYSNCGFGSYNHFFKAFKKECGMTPKQYYQSIQ